jgi:hypothetical protein
MIHSYVTRLLGSVIVGGLITVAAAPATATAIVRTSANSGPESISSDTPSAIANEPYLSSRSHATATTTSTNTVTGALPSCAGPAGCANSGNYPEAGSYASANGNKGTLKVGAVAINGSNARASATAGLRDTITLTNTKIGISVDIDAFGGSNHTGPGQTSGGGSLFFAMSLHVPNAPPESTEAFILFSFEVGRDEDGKGYVAYLRDDPDNPLVISTSVPDVLNFEVDLSSEAFADLFAPQGPFPPAFPLNGPLDISFMLRASADCDSDDCVSVTRADESLYINLQGDSANGYSYPGRGTGPDPDPGTDPVGVPEPMTALLLLSGLLGLAGLRRFSV